LLVVVELFAEVGGEEVVFYADADLRADEEDQDCDGEEDWRGEHEAGAEQEAEHRGVDRVADEAVGAGLDEFVIGAQGGVEAEVSAEGAGAGPGQERREREEENRERDAPGCGGSLPEVALPEERVGDALKEESPSCAGVAFLRGVPVPASNGEGQEPDQPSDEKDCVCVRWHGTHCRGRTAEMDSRLGGLPVEVQGA
jgi:hypothetical protein